MKHTIDQMKGMMIEMYNSMKKLNETVNHMNEDLNITSVKVKPLRSDEWQSWMTSIHQEIKGIKQEITEIKRKKNQN